MANGLVLEFAELQRIFRTLTLPDFLNMANSCEYLRRAIVSYCNEYFKNREICVNSVESNVTTSNVSDLYLLGYDLVLNFLKIFGGGINILTLNDHTNLSEKTLMIGAYISRYCTTLTQINFCCLNTNISINFLESFPTVVSVSFSDSFIHHNFVLNRYFPNLRFLTFFDRNYIENLESVVTFYPFIESLSINQNFHQFLSELNVFVLLNNNVQVNFLPDFDID